MFEPGSTYGTVPEIHKKLYSTRQLANFGKYPLQKPIGFYA
jgi:hypothetical protein